MEAPDEVVEAEGVSLRPVDLRDVAVVVAAGASDVPDWTFIPRDADEATARAFVERQVAGARAGVAVRFAVEVDGATAGMVGGKYVDPADRGVVETYYFVLPEFRRRGLATRALVGFDEWVAGAEPMLRRLQLHVIDGNSGSRRVAEAAGYDHEGVAVAAIGPVNGFGVRDAHVYGRRVGRR